MSFVAEIMQFVADWLQQFRACLYWNHQKAITQSENKMAGFINYNNGELSLSMNKEESAMLTQFEEVFMALGLGRNEHLSCPLSSDKVNLFLRDDLRFGDSAPFKKAQAKLKELIENHTC